MTQKQSAAARERLLRFLIEGRRDITEEDARCRMEKLGFAGWQPLCCVAELSLHLDMYPAERTDELLAQAEETSIRFLSRCGWRVSGYVDSRNSLILLLSADSREPFDALDAQLGKLLERLMTEYGIVIYAGIGEVIANATEIKDSAKDASTCIAYKYSAAGEHVIHIRNIRQLFADTTADHTTAFDRVIGCFLDGNMERLRVRLTELMELLQEAKSRRQVIRQLYLELTTQIVHRASDIGVSIAEGQTAEYLRQILEMDDSGELRRWFEALCEDFIRAINEKRRESSDYIAATAKKYIEENYADHDLSQQSVSEHLGLSLGYFGHLFYAQTGQRFVDYLNRYRLQKAAEMLRGGSERIMVISEATGFNSVNYFNSLFKKHYGMTPKEYRQNRE
ncbi:MAG: helix-turn-helix transcriptional regulator [Ruminococcaceae bacterium]|nr:helix-turn-helix transcriptional regulator [Oscillospiraceae bacterium]